MRVRRFVPILAAVVLNGVAVAATFPLRPAQPAPVLPECTCRYRGQNLALGQHVCLTSPSGPRLAECVREGNVTSWRQGDESCTLTLFNRDTILRPHAPRATPLAQWSWSAAMAL